MSAYGKALVVASMRGNTVITTMVDVKIITIQLNAYIKASINMQDYTLL
jgi:hypothetical protein